MRLLACFSFFQFLDFSQTTRCWFGQCPDWAVYLKCSVYIGCDAPPEQEAEPGHLHNLNTITAYKSKHTFIPRVEGRPSRLKKWTEGIWIPLVIFIQESLTLFYGFSESCKERNSLLILDLAEGEERWRELSLAFPPFFLLSEKGF